jgi:hypothetical protein
MGRNAWTIIFVVAVIALAAWGIMTMPDHRTTGQRLGDAVDTLPQGVNKAAREFEDRTPGERLGDSVKDTGQKIKDSTSNQP